MVSYENLADTTYNLGGKLFSGIWNSEILRTWFIGQWFFWLVFVVLIAIASYLFHATRRTELILRG